MSATAIHLDLFRGYSPHPHAWRFFVDDHRFCLATAGRRGAKTHTGARRFLRKVFDDYARKANEPYQGSAAKRGTALWWDRRPRLHYWVAAHESEQLDEPKRYILEILPPELLEHADNSKGRMWLHGDILIEFKSLHDAKQKVGSGLNGIWIEEAARVAANAWQGFIMHLLADKVGWAQFTTTPLGEDWTFEQLVKQADKTPDSHSFHTWTMADNIRVPEVVAYSEWCKANLPPAYYRRECEASYDAFIGQIYEHFNEATMVTADVPRGVQLVRRIGCQDWGFTAPGAQVVLGLTSGDPNKAHVWAVDEVYSNSQLVEDFWVPEARRLMQSPPKGWGFNEWVADPAEPDNLERMKRAGIRMVGHKNYMMAKFDEHERSVRAGIRVLSALMFQGRFHVTRKCPNLISEIKSYRWAQNRGGGLVETPEGGQKEHAATATRYGVTYSLKGASFEPLAMAA